MLLYLYKNLVRWSEQTDTPLTLMGKLPTIRVQIDLDKLNKAHLSLIINLFKYYLQENHQHAINLYFDQSSTFALRSPVEVPTAALNKTSLTPEALKKNNLLKIFQHATIFKGLITAMTDFNLPVDPSAWSSAMQVLMRAHMEVPITNGNLVPHFRQTVNYLDELSQHDTRCLEMMYGPLVILSIRCRQLDYLVPQLESAPYKGLISKLNRSYYFLHETLQEGHFAGFLFLLTLIEREDIIPDKKGNSLWHLYAALPPDKIPTPKAIRKTILALGLDINHHNEQGNTPLHAATLKLDHMRFFLKHGAEVTCKNKKDESPLDFISRSYLNSLCGRIPINQLSDPKHIYYAYKIYGKALSIPLKRDSQKGPTCGFYGLHSMLSFFRAKFPDEMTKPPKARKKDYPNKKQDLTSLRKLRKELSIPYHGPLFSVHHLTKIIRKLGCHSLICDITDYQGFIGTINFALDNDLPLMVPFSVDNTGYPELVDDPKADHAHWATINGYLNEGNECILVTQGGRDFNMSAKDLFHAFFNIEPILREAYLLKKAKGTEWLWLGNAKPTLEEGNLLEVVPQTDLSDFRRKLVIGLPPSADPEEIRQRLNPPKNSLETVSLKI